MSKEGSRLALIDALKALASQLIVLHHLAFYGPMSDYAQELCPGLMSWLYDYARIAVQAFLVMGGFLAAKTLTKNGQLVEKPVVALIWRRYLKLVLPYLGALLLGILGAALARSLMTHEATPELPTLPQFVAHVLLLQSVLGFDGLSAGVWYVAIDFQLYTLLLITLWLAHRLLPKYPNAGRWLFALLAIASLFYFNRDDDWDNWALYFAGAYGLGAIVQWTVRRGTAPVWLATVVALVALALSLDFRLRIAVALAVAIVLGLARYTGFIESWPKSKFIAWLGQISYSVFLVHYPIELVTNALFERFVPHTPTLQLTGMMVAWAMSIAGGALFFKQVECRAQRWLSGKPRTASATP